MLIPLAANLGTIIQILVFAVVLLSWIVRLFSEAREAEARKKAVQKPRRRPPIDPMQEPGAPVARQDRRPAPQAQAAAGRKSGGPLQGEVDEFLRQAGLARKEPGPQQQQREAARGENRPSKPMRVELIEVQPEESKPRRLVEQSQRLTTLETRPDSVTSEATKLGLGSEVARHVADHLAQGKLSEHASQLGHDIEQTDERLAARLKSKFDHRLGKLDDGNDPVAGTTSTKSESPFAAEILGMMSSPEGMRQAIILNEILTRPADRW